MPKDRALKPNRRQRYQIFIEVCPADRAEFDRLCLELGCTLRDLIIRKVLGRSAEDPLFTRVANLESRLAALEAFAFEKQGVP